jgi:hypothetical protein
MLTAPRLPRATWEPSGLNATAVTGPGWRTKVAEEVGVVAAGGAFLVVGDLVEAGEAEVATVKDLLFLRMNREAEAGFQRIVDVVDEPAIFKVDQLHRAIAPR